MAAVSLDALTTSKSLHSAVTIADESPEILGQYLFAHHAIWAICADGDAPEPDEQVRGTATAIWHGLPARSRAFWSARAMTARLVMYPDEFLFIDRSTPLAADHGDKASQAYTDYKNAMVGRLPEDGDSDPDLFEESAGTVTERAKTTKFEADGDSGYLSASNRKTPRPISPAEEDNRASETAYDTSPERPGTRKGPDADLSKITADDDTIRWTSGLTTAGDLQSQYEPDTSAQRVPPSEPGAVAHTPAAETSSPCNEPLDLLSSTSKDRQHSPSTEENEEAAVGVQPASVDISSAAVAPDSLFDDDETEVSMPEFDATDSPTFIPSDTHAEENTVEPSLPQQGNLAILKEEETLDSKKEEGPNFKKKEPSDFKKEEPSDFKKEVSSDLNEKEGFPISEQGKQSLQEEPPVIKQGEVSSPRQETSSFSKREEWFFSKPKEPSFSRVRSPLNWAEESQRQSEIDDYHRKQRRSPFQEGRITPSNASSTSYVSKQLQPPKPVNNPSQTKAKISWEGFGDLNEAKQFMAKATKGAFQGGSKTKSKTKYMPFEEDITSTRSKPSANTATWSEAPPSNAWSKKQTAAMPPTSNPWQNSKPLTSRRSSNTESKDTSTDGFIDSVADDGQNFFIYQALPIICEDLDLSRPDGYSYNMALNMWKDLPRPIKKEWVEDARVLRGGSTLAATQLFQTEKFAESRFTKNYRQQIIKALAERNDGELKYLQPEYEKLVRMEQRLALKEAQQKPQSLQTKSHARTGSKSSMPFTPSISRSRESSAVRADPCYPGSVAGSVTDRSAPPAHSTKSAVDYVNAEDAVATSTTTPQNGGWDIKRKIPGKKKKEGKETSTATVSSSGSIAPMSSADTRHDRPSSQTSAGAWDPPRPTPHEKKREDQSKVSSVAGTSTSHETSNDAKDGTSQSSKAMRKESSWPGPVESHEDTHVSASVPMQAEAAPVQDFGGWDDRRHIPGSKKKKKSKKLAETEDFFDSVSLPPQSEAGDGKGEWNTVTRQKR